jgi:hypothetical protein
MSSLEWPARFPDHAGVTAGAQGGARRGGAGFLRCGGRPARAFVPVPRSGLVVSLGHEWEKAGRAMNSFLETTHGA